MNDFVTKHAPALRQVLILALTTATWYGILAQHLSQQDIPNLALRPTAFESVLGLILTIVLVYLGSAFGTQEKEYRHRYPLIFWPTVAIAFSPILLGLAVMALILLMDMFRT